MLALKSTFCEIHPPDSKVRFHWGLVVKTTHKMQSNIEKAGWKTRGVDLQNGSM